MATPRTVKGVSDSEWEAIGIRAAAAGLTIGRYLVALSERADGEPITVLNPRQPRRQDIAPPAPPAADLDRAERLVRLGIEAGGRATHAARRLAVALIDGAGPSAQVATPPPLVALPAPAPEPEAEAA